MVVELFEPPVLQLLGPLPLFADALDAFYRPLVRNGGPLDVDLLGDLLHLPVDNVPRRGDVV